MKKLLIALMTSAAALSVAVSAEAAEKLKACWVYVGPVGDFGYSYQHDQGRLAVEKKLGDKVETAYLENVAEGPDAERAFERLARQGCKLIFGTSFGFMDAEVKVAAKFPDIKFEHATGYKTAPNLGIYNARFYEGRYILGQIAAKESKAGVAGYIVSFPIPEVVMGINSFMLGAQSVNPNFKAKIVWVNSWFDPGKEADAAKALFDQGADVIVQHTDSTAPLQVAQERGLHGFGQASDMIKFAPHFQRLWLFAGAGRHLEAGRPLGRHQGWCRAHGALHQHGGRREGDGGSHAEEDRRWLEPLHRPGRETGRHAVAEGRRSGRRQDVAWHELLRQGRGRQAAAVSLLTTGCQGGVGRKIAYL